jgi:hypothetical protein
MKKLFTLVITMLLGASLAFAQDTSGGTGNTSKTTTAGKKPTTKTSKAHKGGKKSKKPAPAASPTPAK